MPKPIGFVVVDDVEDWSQPLTLRTGDKLPPGGVLEWGEPIALFPTRAAAQAAIRRTHHFAQAFGRTNLPEPKCCKVRPVAAVNAPGGA